MSKRIVIALGGNALGKTLHEQMEAVQKTSKKIVELLKQGFEIVLTHGNGPQVGLMLDIFDEYKIHHDIDEFTMSVCVSITQGYIGYDLQNVMREEILNQGMNIPTATIITQVIVDKDDPAFANPTKPIGLYLNEEQAEHRRQKGDHVIFIEDEDYRQVVASPKPQNIVEAESIKALLDGGQLVIACGGGGIPVVEQGNHLKGVQAVIDKDLSSAKLAQLIQADYFVILTNVEKVCLNYHKENQMDIDEMTIQQANEYIEQEHFREGSMLPKVVACMNVIKDNPKCKTLITSIDKLADGIDGKTGTKIVP